MKNEVQLLPLSFTSPIRHGAWLDKGRVDFHLPNRIETKDGHSTSLACALLLESLFTRAELSENYACIGSVNSDSSVQSVGGVVRRLQAARQGGAPVVMLPEGNTYALSDLAILGEARLNYRNHAGSI